MRVQTISGLLKNTHEVGECREWRGSYQNNVPFVRHAGKTDSVRRIIMALQGKPLERGYVVATSCGNQRCIALEHLRVKELAQHMRKIAKEVDHQSLTRRLKLQRYARENTYTIDDATVAAIRDDTCSARAAAAKYGVSKSYVSLLRSNKRRADISASPWAGLM